MNDLSTASNQLKHQIKTLLLSLPPHSQHKHTCKSGQGPQPQSKGHCHCSGLWWAECFLGLLSPLEGKDGSPGLAA